MQALRPTQHRVFLKQNACYSGIQRCQCECSSTHQTWHLTVSLAVQSSLSHPSAMQNPSYPYTPTSPVRDYAGPPVVSSHGVPPSNYGVVGNPGPGQVSGLARYHDAPYGHGAIPLQTGQWTQVDAGPGRGPSTVGASHTLPTAVNMPAMQPGQRASQYQHTQGYPNWPASGGMRSSVPPINPAYGDYSGNDRSATRQSWATSSPTVGTPQRRDSG